MGRKRSSCQRFLVRHDYGMGALWWWVTASSAAEITAAFAELEVVDDPAAIAAVGSWQLEETDVADAVSGPLAGFYRKREQQRQDPSFGKLLGKDRVYLRLADPDVDPGVWLSEHDRAGRRLRQVELQPDGTAVASSASDWPMNPPFDPGDPQYTASQISAGEFEQAWQRATGHQE